MKKLRLTEPRQEIGLGGEQAGRGEPRREAKSRNAANLFPPVKHAPAPNDLRDEMASYGELTKACGRALDLYIREAQKMCELLAQHTDGPADQAERIAIMEQRLRENDAAEYYRAARLASIEAAKLGG